MFFGPFFISMSVIPKGVTQVHDCGLLVNRDDFNTVYRENFAPVLFSPSAPSELRANLKLG